MVDEINIEEINPVDIVKKQLWEALDFLRAFIDIEECYFALFFVLLYRDGLIDKRILDQKENIREKIYSDINKFKGVNRKVYIAIYSAFEFIIKSFGPNITYDLLKHITSIDQFTLREHFPEIFDDFLYKFSKAIDRYSGESILPIELSHFVCDLIDIPKNATVYNPFAGRASFGVFLKHSPRYLGQEINEKTWAIGAMRLIAYKRIRESRFILGDSIIDWNPNGQKFDLIIANPPFGMRLTQDIQGRFGNIRTIEQFFLEKGIDDLSTTGKLLAVLPNGFLFRSGIERELRKYLVENDLVETIISLPGGILINTSIPCIILVLNKAKLNPGFIRMVDANSFVEPINKRINKLNSDALNSLINSQEATESQKFIPNKEIANFDFNLTVQRYFIEEITPEERCELFKLGNLIKPHSREPIEVGIRGKFVRIRDLAENTMNFEKTFSDIETLNIPRHASILRSNSLLLALRWKTLKPTYFSSAEEPVYFSTPDILACRIINEKVTKEYLVNELQSDYVQNQLEKLRTGTVVPTISKMDLLDIVIQLPSLVEQKAKVKGLKEAYFRQREIELKLEKELLGLKEDSSRDIKSIRHTLNQYLNALKSNISGTRKFLQTRKETPITFDTIYSENLNQTFGEHILSLESTVDFMSKLLFQVDEKKRSKVPEFHNLRKLIQDAQNRFKNPDRFLFEEIFMDYESYSEGETVIDPLVQIYEEDFFSIYSNIISNAVDHGFKSLKKRYTIRTTISYDKESEMCVVEISNNGDPIDEKFTFTRLITRGEKTNDSNGSGTGGADIKDRIQQNNGIFDLVADSTNEFPVTYVIKLPLMKVIDEL